MSTILQIIQLAAVVAIPIVFAITLHEAAHGYAAKYFGDSTAAEAGRISMNPLRHVDPVGTIALPLGILLMGHLTGSSLPMFGWAKPVPVNFNNLRRPKADMFWVAAAGPAINLLMALGWAAVLVFARYLEHGPMLGPLVGMAYMGISINVVLMVLNLLPIPPLDGGRIAVSLLPMPLARRFIKLERYGIIILLFLIFAPSMLNVPPFFAIMLNGLSAWVTRFILSIFA